MQKKIVQTFPNEVIMFLRCHGYWEIRWAISVHECILLQYDTIKVEEWAMIIIIAICHGQKEHETGCGCAE